MKTLVLDIETSPNLAHVWGLWQQNVGLPQLLQSGEVLCWAAKWVGEEKVHFGSKQTGPVTYLKRIYDLVDRADVVVHFNGKSFDMPWLRSEWVRLGWVPPSPSIEIDLCLAAKRNFRFPSNKLQYLAAELLSGSKVQNGGHGLWIKCMAGDREAWKTMRAYNEHDVVLTEALYERLKPWLKLPSPYLMGDVQDPHACPHCGSSAIQARGLAHTALSSYQRYRCNDCGHWSRGGTRNRAATVR